MTCERIDGCFHHEGTKILKDTKKRNIEQEREPGMKNRRLPFLVKILIPIGIIVLIA